MCETMLQRLINALGDAADRYGEPPDPDPEAQAAMPTDGYITSPTGQHWLTYRAIRSGHSGVDWLRLAQHATREARALHPDRDPMNTAGGILAGFLRYHFTPRPEVPGLDARTDLLAWACGRVDWPYVARLLLADAQGEELGDDV